MSFDFDVERAVDLNLDAGELLVVGYVKTGLVAKLFPLHFYDFADPALVNAHALHFALKGQHLLEKSAISLQSFQSLLTELLRFLPSEREEGVQNAEFV